MQIPWFVWRDRDSRSMGVTLAEFPALCGPAERVREVAVPGRPGAVTLAGTGGGARTRLSLRLLIMPGGSVPAVLDWLRGAGGLILGDSPDRVSRARVDGEVRFLPVGGGWYAGTAAFLLQPGKAQVPPEADITVTTEGVAIYNPGDLPARPIYTIRGLGRMVLQLRPTDKYSQVAVDPTGQDREIGLTGAVIDTDAMTVTSLDGSESLTEITNIYYNDIRGLWIPPHESVLVDAGISDELGSTSSVTVTPRWRWL